MPQVSSTYPGKIDFPTATEGPFESIIYGAPCNVEIVYNSDIVPSTGPYEYLTDGGASGYISVVISDMNFVPNSDNSGSPGWPIIQFNDGQFAGLSFYTKYTESGETYVFSVNGLDWNFVDAETNQVMASGTISNLPQ